MKKKSIVLYLSMMLAVLTLLLSGCGLRLKPGLSQEEKQETKEPESAVDETGEPDFTSGDNGSISRSDDETGTGEDETETRTETTQGDGETVDDDRPAVTLDTSSQLTGLHHVRIRVQDYGTMILELDADTAPLSVTNFISLAQEGFYDGLTFHRIISGFMIQGGAPRGDVNGNSGRRIEGEFSSNGIENPISHERGVISMARSADPNSASSQFFIVHKDSTFLDGQYAAFGHVTDGIEVVDRICEDAKPTDDNGRIPEDQQPVIESIDVLD